MWMMAKQLMMVWGGLLFVQLLFWWCVDVIGAFIIYITTIFSFQLNIDHFDRNENIVIKKL